MNEDTNILLRNFKKFNSLKIGFFATYEKKKLEKIIAGPTGRGFTLRF